MVKKRVGGLPLQGMNPLPFRQPDAARAKSLRPTPFPAPGWIAFPRGKTYNRGMKRKFFHQSILVGFALLSLAACSCGCVKDLPYLEPRPVLELQEMSVQQLRQGYAEGRFTVSEVVGGYLQPDRGHRPQRSPAQLGPARQPRRPEDRGGAGLPSSRPARPRGPLHGIPVILKDNIDSLDPMPTTAGATVLRDSFVGSDSRVAKRLREAGRRHPGQGQHERMGQLPRQLLLERLERRRRPDAQPLRARPQPLRLELGLGRRRRGQPLRPGHRHRDQRFDRLPGQQQRHRRPQAHRRAWSAAAASSPSPSPRTRPVPWGARSRTWPSASAPWPGSTQTTPRPWPPRATCTPIMPNSSRRTACAGSASACMKNLMGYHYRVDALLEQAATFLKSQGAEVIEVDGAEGGSDRGRLLPGHAL